MEDILDGVVWEIFFSCDLREEKELVRESWGKRGKIIRVWRIIMV